MRTRTSRRIVLPVALVLAVALLGSCSRDEDNGPEVPDLATVIVDQAPPGFVPLTEPFGAFDLEGYLSRFSDEEDRDREDLTDAGFERGYARGWVSTDGTALAAFVFEVESNGEAEDLLDSFMDDTKDRRNGSEFEAEGIDDAEGITYVESSVEGAQTVYTLSLHDALPI